MTQTIHQSRVHERRGQSSTRLIVVTLAVSLATFLITSGLIVGYRTLEGEEKLPENSAVRPAKTSTWEERLAHVPAKAPPNEPRRKTPPARDTNAPVALEKPAESAPSSETTGPVAPVGVFHAVDLVWILDDFERNDPDAWDVKSWANPADLSVVNGELLVSLKNGQREKTAIGRPFKVDLTSRKILSMDVRNETAGNVGIAVALITGGAAAYYESEPRTAGTGQTVSIAFDLTSARFKCAASSWEHRTAIGGPEAVKSLCILLYDAVKGNVFFDNIRCLSVEQAEGAKE